MKSKGKGLQLPKSFRKFKPFSQRLKDGDICNVVTAAKIIGFSEQHLRRLCHDKAVACLVRGGTQFYFEPQHIEALFIYRKATK